MSTTPTIRGIDFHLLLRALRRRAGAGALATLACLVALVTTLALLPFSYVASTQILVKVARDVASAPVIGSTSNDAVVMTGVRSEDVASEIELLTSSAVIEAAVQTLGAAAFEPDGPARGGIRALISGIARGSMDAAKFALTTLNLRKKLTPREELVGRINNRLRAERIARSDMISVSLRWSSPERAAIILDAVLEAYVTIRGEARSVFRGTALFDSVVREYEARLAEIGTEIRVAHERAGLVDAGTQIQVATRRFGELQIEIETVGVGIAEVTGEIALLQRQYDELLRTAPELEPAGNDELMLSLRRRLSELRLERLRETQRLGERSEQARMMSEAVSVQQQEMRSADLARIERAMAAARLRLALLEVRRDALTQQMAETRARAQELFEARTVIQALERRQVADETAYRRLRVQQEDAASLARLDREGVSNVRILGGARAVATPAGPRKLLLLAIGFAVSLMLGFFTMVFIEWRSDMAGRSATGMAAQA